MTGKHQPPVGDRRSIGKTDTRATTKTIPAVLFGLAVVCAVLAGIILFDVGEILTGDPPVNGTDDGAGIGFTGIVGAQEAEVREAYDSRSFEERLAEATDDESRATAIVTERERIRTRLDALEVQRTALEEIDDDDDDREYRTLVTGFVAQSLILEQRLDQVEAAAEALSPPVRVKFDLTDRTFGVLRDRVTALTTPEMVDYARGVAGDDIGDDLDDEDADDDEDGDDDNEDDRESSEDDDQDDDDNDPLVERPTSVSRGFSADSRGSRIRTGTSRKFGRR